MDKSFTLILLGFVLLFFSFRLTVSCGLLCCFLSFLCVLCQTMLAKIVLFHKLCFFNGSIVTFNILHGSSIERLSTVNHCFGPRASHNELNISCSFTVVRIQFNSIQFVCNNSTRLALDLMIEPPEYISFALSYQFSTPSHHLYGKLFRCVCGLQLIQNDLNTKCA